jgi:cytochrome c oxidase subunit II
MYKNKPVAVHYAALVTAAGATAATCMAAASAFAAEGQAENWQLGFQPPASPIADGIQNVHTFLLIIVSGIVLFVLGLLIWVMLRYNEKANPTPSRTSHNTVVEVLWTIVPVMILVIIAIPSFRLLFAQYNVPKVDLTIKATGQQWYWDYEYPDYGSLSFSSTILDDNELKPGQPRLLSVDNEVVVPVNKVVQVLTTASTVIHNWTVPSLGSKVDAVPGRVSRTWFKADRTGVFYGQCMELCGRDHARMPIAIRVVTDAEFAAWVEKSKKQASNRPAPPPVQAAATEPAGTSEVASTGY